VHFVASEESVWAGFELDGLKLSKGASDSRPRSPAGQLGCSPDEKGKGADLYVRFNSAWQPVINRCEVNLSAFEGPEEGSMISRFLYPQAASSTLRVSSLVMMTFEDNLKTGKLDAPRKTLRKESFCPSEGVERENGLFTQD
jgi:hypothetical protein